MPRDAHQTEFPSVKACKRNIYGAMIKKCGQETDEYNVGTINVDTPPNASSEGLPLVDGFPRYLMAYEELDS